MKSVPVDEQETTINMEAQSKTAEVYTCEPRTIATMQKLAEAHPDEVVIEHPDDYGIIVRLPRRWVRVKAPFTRNYTEEQRQAFRERLAQRNTKRSE